MSLSIIFKAVIVGLLLFIVFNLFRALFIMLKNDPNGPKVSTFLGRRVLFSAVVIILIIIAMGTGIIQPNPSPTQYRDKPKVENSQTP